MSPWDPLRRYLPLLVVLGVLAGLVAFQPSRPVTLSPGTNGTAGGSYVSPYAGAAPPATSGGSAAGAAGPATGAATAPAGGTAGPAAPAGQAGSRGGPRGATTVTVNANGTVTSNVTCAGRRAFSPAIDSYAPPCAGNWTGRNGGATSMGVTARTVTVVVEYPKPNPALSTVNGASASRSGPSLQQFDAAAVAFLNQHLQMYGRHIVIQNYENGCNQQPPDDTCLRNAATSIVNLFHPMFMWDFEESDTAEWDQLSRLGVINLGGLSFTRAFDRQHAPYHWDITQDANSIADQSAQFWCRELAGHNASYAGSATLQSSPRNLGVVYINGAQDIYDYFLGRLKSGCGATVSHSYAYAADPSTAEQQRVAAAQKMQSPPPAATTVLCLCDPLSPVLLISEFRQENYYPELIFNSYGVEDIDAAQQTFGADCTGSGGGGCELSNAFAVSSGWTDESITTGPPARVWAAEGGSGTAGSNSNFYWDYWNLIGTMIQSAGPDLTPGNVDAAMHALAPLAGPGLDMPLRYFPAGSYQWNQDARIAYWSTQRTSAANGSTGTWVTVGPRRYPHGGIPSGPFAAPPKPR